MDPRLPNSGFLPFTYSKYCYYQRILLESDLVMSCFSKPPTVSYSLLNKIQILERGKVPFHSLPLLLPSSMHPTTPAALDNLPWHSSPFTAPYFAHIVPFVWYLFPQFIKGQIRSKYLLFVHPYLYSSTLYFLCVQEDWLGWITSIVYLIFWLLIGFGYQKKWNQDSLFWQSPCYKWRLILSPWRPSLLVTTQYGFQWSFSFLAPWPLEGTQTSFSD